MTNEISPPDSLCLHPEALRPGNRFTLLRDGAEAYPRMLGAIRGAQRSVHLETYIFAEDATGRRFAEALSERARAGVEGRVVYDGVGSLGVSRDFFGAIRAAGARVIQFHPVLLSFAGFSYRRRDHRKLLVVDGRVGFVGGLNIARDYDSPEQGGLGWRDTHAEVEGPVVGDLERMFAELWDRERQSNPPVTPSPAPGPAEGGVPALVASSHVFQQRWEIVKHYVHAIRAARRRVWIANPYFLPSRNVRVALRKAARRGIDVRVLLPGKADSLAVQCAVRRLYAAYLRWGIRLFEWPGPMMHAKTAVIDGAWATVGSYNIDHRSLMHNYEVTAVVLSPEFGGRLEAMFEEDFGRSREVRQDEWRRRPWREKFLEDLFHTFRHLM